MLTAMLGASLAGVTAPASAQATDGLAPTEFASAVLSRLNLMLGTPNASIAEAATFADLQYSIAALATNSTGTYVDPDTGNPWQLSALLEQADGQSTWLPSSSGPLAEEKQIESVLESMGWRLAAYPAFQGLTVAITDGKLAPGFTTDPANGQCVAKPAQVQRWASLFSQAESGTWASGGGFLGAEASANGAGSSVGIGRGVINAVLPGAGHTASGMPPPATTLPWQSGLPIPGVAVDGARVVLEIDAFGTGGSKPGVTPGGAHWDTNAGDITITGGPGADNLSFQPDGQYAQPQPTLFGTFFPQRIPGTSTGYIHLDVPTSFLFQSVQNPLQPVFKPAALIQMKAEEPPPSWPSGRDLGTTCSDNEEWTVGDVSDQARPAGLGGDPVIFHEALGPLSLKAEPPLGVDWTMPPRLTSQLAKKWGAEDPDGLPPKSYVDPDSWRVNLFITEDAKRYCPPGYSYRWTVTGQNWHETYGAYTYSGPGCEITVRVPKLGVYKVQATQFRRGVVPTGRVAENPDVVVRDWLLVGVGDSNGSGEGNPPFFFPQCDRSTASYQFQTAQYIEDLDPRSSVTLLFTSCSGARTDHLWRNYYAGIQPGRRALAPQFRQIQGLIGSRKIDAVIMSIGINDLYFGPLMTFCVERYVAGEQCQLSFVKAVRDPQGYVTDYEPLDGGNVKGRARTTARLTYQTQQLLEALPGHYRQTASELSGLHPEHVFITEYPTNAYDENGLLCVSGKGRFPAFPRATWQWLAETGDALNEAVLGTRSLGWTVVSGIPNAFMKHGYCADDSYFVPITNALSAGNKAGSFHPNARGQAINSSLTRPVVCEALYRNKQCNGIAPPPPQ
ncbi:MAG TPA: hypothetical protein VMS00_08565 [Acidimicrobiales bacterium]|nr:hypothetical protein [Acidimicrobiales bacterium]